MIWSDHRGFRRPFSPARMGGLRCSRVARRGHGGVGSFGSRIRVGVLLGLLSWCVTPPSVSAQVTGEIRGTVVDTTANTGVALARIDVVGNTGHVVSGPDGRFVLRGVEPGERERLFVEPLPASPAIDMETFERQSSPTRAAADALRRRWPLYEPALLDDVLQVRPSHRACAMGVRPLRACAQSGSGSGSASATGAGAGAK